MLDLDQTVLAGEATGYILYRYRPIYICTAIISCQICPD